MPTKFNWIGSMNDEVSVCVAWHTTGITRFEEVMQKELMVGGTGPAADTDQFPKVLNAVLGTRFKIVTGYPGGNDDRPGDGTWRGVGSLRLVVVERESPPTSIGSTTARSTCWCSCR